MAGGGAGARLIAGVGTGRGVRAGTAVGSGMGDAITTTACVTSDRAGVATGTLVNVGTNVNTGNDVAPGSTPPLHAAATSVRNNNVIIRNCRSGTRMPILVGRINGRPQVIAPHFDSTGARLSERVHFLRPTVAYRSLCAGPRCERAVEFTAGPGGATSCFKASLAVGTGCRFCQNSELAT